jgi:hypothetical protein
MGRSEQKGHVFLAVINEPAVDIRHFLTWLDLFDYVLPDNRALVDGMIDALFLFRRPTTPGEVYRFWNDLDFIHSHFPTTDQRALIECLKNEPLPSAAANLAA